MPPALSPIDLTAAVGAAASGDASLKVSELKCLLQQRGIAFTGCVKKDDLVQRLVDSGGGGGIGGIDTGAPPFDSGSFHSTMKVAEMKRQLQQRGISFADCIEKSELIKLLESSKDRSIPAENDNGAKNKSSGPPGKKNNAAGGGRGGGGAHPFFSAGYTAQRAAASAAGAASAANARNPNRDPLGPLADGESKTVDAS
jgi:hypothetical protein